MKNGSIRFLCILLAIAFFLTSDWSTGTRAKPKRGIGLVRVTAKNGKSVDLYKGSHALLIGISDYTAWPDLPSIPGELEDLQNALEAKNFNVVTIMNPTEGGLRTGYVNSSTITDSTGRIAF